MIILYKRIITLRSYIWNISSEYLLWEVYRLESLEVYREKYGFIKDKDIMCSKYSLSGRTLQTICIDIYADHPYMLLSRVDEKDVYTTFDGERIIFSNKNKTTIANLLRERVDDWAVKVYDDSRFMLVLSIHNLCYKIFITK